MKRQTFPLCMLLLAASLASCAPSVQGPAGTSRPNVVVGAAYVFSVHIRADQITDQTPGDVYASFDDCLQAGVSVGDVRRLGLEVADQACREARSGANSFVLALGAVAVAAGVIFAVMLSHVADAFTPAGDPVNRTSLPLGALLLAASLASCAPTVQTAQGPYRANVVTGIPFALATKIPAEGITGQTPGDVYATFADCPSVAVSVADVRRLGVEAADGLCRDVDGRVSSAQRFSVVLGAFLILPALYFFYLLFQTFLSVFGG